ncbi:hypothetical protein [Parasporobacterium paucivorans]|nr:hypothetical protein [Parasporobacterium paucivorans]
MRTLTRMNFMIFAAGMIIGFFAKPQPNLQKCSTYCPKFSEY